MCSCLLENRPALHQAFISFVLTGSVQSINGKIPFSQYDKTGIFWIRSGELDALSGGILVAFAQFPLSPLGPQPWRYSPGTSFCLFSNEDEKWKEAQWKIYLQTRLFWSGSHKNKSINKQSNFLNVINCLGNPCNHWYQLLARLNQQRVKQQYFPGNMLTQSLLYQISSSKPTLFEVI